LDIAKVDDRVILEDVGGSVVALGERLDPVTREPLLPLSQDRVTELGVGRPGDEAIAAWVVTSELDALDTGCGCLAIGEPTTKDLDLRLGVEELLMDGVGDDAELLHP
jgi:hypothetical protein